MRIICFIIGCFFLNISVTELNAQILKFKGGHSHNDYAQKRPLFEAVEHGIVSVEADIYLRDGKLLVGHDEKDLTVERTLESLYLRPLLKLNTNPNKKFSPIILMIDIKDKGEETYTELKKVLFSYRGILTRFVNNRMEQNSVTIIISGERPVEILRNETERYVFLDGRISDLENSENSNLFPLISDDWDKYFSWKGIGEISSEELGKLIEIVEACHLQNKMIRFWGISNELPATNACWSILWKAGVDLIGCDCPSCLEQYLEKSAKNKIEE